jgi:hypothetical protein
VTNPWTWYWFQRSPPNLEQNHEWPGLVRWNARLASFSRLIVFDKRGTGLSDYAPGPVVLEDTMQDVLAVLDSWERFKAERSLAQRVAGAVTDDPDTIEFYFGYARQGRSALWVHVPDDADAKRAVRALADHQVLHLRHYGHDSQQDIHIR